MCRTFICLVSAALLFPLFIVAQSADSTTIAGYIHHDPSRQNLSSIVLYTFNEGDNPVTIPVNFDGNFEARVYLKEPVVYKLVYNGYYALFLVNPAEKRFYVDIVDSAGMRSLAAINSADNDAYADNRSEIFRFMDTLKILHEANPAETKKSREDLLQVIANHNTRRADLAKKYKGTFTITELGGLGQLPEIKSNQPVFEQVQKHFFDFANLGATRTYICKDLHIILSNYVDFIADTAAAARVDLVKSLFEKAKGNVDARKELTSVVIGCFTRGNREPYLQSFTEWALVQPGFETENPMAHAKLKMVEKVLPGKPMTDVSGSDTSGNSRSLSETVEKSQATLLIFWAPDCGHCQESMPKFKEVYNKYHSKGLDVFAVSMGNEWTPWKKFIAEKQLPWVNIIMPTNPAIYSEYFLQNTPTVVIIDKQGKILHRFFELEDLEKYVERIFAPSAKGTKKNN